MDLYLKKLKTGIFGEIGQQESTTSPPLAWWPKYIEMLCHLPYPDTCRRNFLIALREYYQDKHVELRLLDEFEKTYTSDSAIWWYTRDTFLYRLLNKALRQQNTKLIFLFGFYIKDIYSTLKAEYEIFKARYSDEASLTVYRGQLMSQNEIARLQKENYDEITVNSFFSTSLDRESVLFLLDPSVLRDDGLQSVLFEIKLYTQWRYRPFGNISHRSSFPDESEIRGGSNTS